MKQEQFKNVCQHIYLTSQQKDRIWKQIETASNRISIRKRALLPTRAAVCFGALLMSGMTVFAASELSLMDKLSDAINVLTQSENTPTPEQQNLYEQYGQALDCEIALESGTLRLDAALYDENNLIIPFRYRFHSDVEGYEALTAGTDLNQQDLRTTESLYHLDTNAFLRQVRFRTLQDSIQTDTGSLYLMTNPVLSEDGTISGSFLVSTKMSKSFEQGTVIQLVKTADPDATDQAAESTDKSSPAADKSAELYAEFTLGKALMQHELTLDADNAAALKDMGASIEKMSLSPLSLCYSGTGTHPGILTATITVVLKDGQIIKKSPNGGGYTMNDTNEDDTGFSFAASVFFAEPILLEEVAKIHIRNSQGADIHIPVEYRPTE